MKLLILVLSAWTLQAQMTCSPQFNVSTGTVNTVCSKSTTLVTASTPSITQNLTTGGSPTCPGYTCSYSATGTIPGGVVTGPTVTVTDNWGSYAKYWDCQYSTDGVNFVVVGGTTFPYPIKDRGNTLNTSAIQFDPGATGTVYCKLVPDDKVGAQGPAGPGLPAGSGASGQPVIWSGPGAYDYTLGTNINLPTQTTSVRNMPLLADGVGGTKWGFQDWFGRGLGNGRVTRTWIPIQNALFPTNTDLTCQVTTGGTCTAAAVNPPTVGTTMYRQAVMLTTGAGFGGWANPYGYFPVYLGWYDNVALMSVARFYNASGTITGYHNAFGIAIDSSASSSLLGSSGVAASSGDSLLAIRHHVNTDYNDGANWQCVYYGGSSGTVVDSGVPFDNAFHTFEILALSAPVSGPQNLLYFIDGTQVCAAGIAAAAYTPTQFFTFSTSAISHAGRYMGLTLYNIATMTGNEVDMRGAGVSWSVR